MALSRRERGFKPFSLRETTAWMHDSRDGGGRAASGTAAEEVEQRRDRLPKGRG